MRKKWFIPFMALVALFAFVACSGEPADSEFNVNYAPVIKQYSNTEAYITQGSLANDSDIFFTVNGEVEVTKVEDKTSETTKEFVEFGQYIFKYRDGLNILDPFTVSESEIITSGTSSHVDSTIKKFQLKSSDSIKAWAEKGGKKSASVEYRFRLIDDETTLYAAKLSYDNNKVKIYGPEKWDVYYLNGAIKDFKTKLEDQYAFDSDFDKIVANFTKYSAPFEADNTSDLYVFAKNPNANEYSKLYKIAVSKIAIVADPQLPFAYNFEDVEGGKIIYFKSLDPTTVTNSSVFGDGINQYKLAIKTTDKNGKIEVISTNFKNTNPGLYTESSTAKTTEKYMYIELKPNDTTTYDFAITWTSADGQIKRGEVFTMKVEKLDAPTADDFALSFDYAKFVNSFVTAKADESAITEFETNTNYTAAKEYVTLTNLNTDNTLVVTGFGTSSEQIKFARKGYVTSDASEVKVYKDYRTSTNKFAVALDGSFVDYADVTKAAEDTLKFYKVDFEKGLGGAQRVKAITKIATINETATVIGVGFKPYKTRTYTDLVEATYEITLEVWNTTLAPEFNKESIYSSNTNVGLTIDFDTVSYNAETATSDCDIQEVYYTNAKTGKKNLVNISSTNLKMADGDVLEFYKKGALNTATNFTTLTDATVMNFVKLAAITDTDYELDAYGLFSFDGIRAGYINWTTETDAGFNSDTNENLVFPLTSGTTIVMWAEKDPDYNAVNDTYTYYIPTDKTSFTSIMSEIKDTDIEWYWVTSGSDYLVKGYPYKVNTTPTYFVAEWNEAKMYYDFTELDFSKTYTSDTLISCVYKNKLYSSPTTANWFVKTSTNFTAFTTALNMDQVRFTKADAGYDGYKMTYYATTMTDSARDQFATRTIYYAKTSTSDFSTWLSKTFNTPDNNVIIYQGKGDQQINTNTDKCMYVYEVITDKNGGISNSQILEVKCEETGLTFSSFTDTKQISTTKTSWTFGYTDRTWVTDVVFTILPEGETTPTTFTNGDSSTYVTKYVMGEEGKDAYIEFNANLPATYNLVSVKLNEIGKVAKEQTYPKTIEVTNLGQLLSFTTDSNTYKVKVTLPSGSDKGNVRSIVISDGSYLQNIVDAFDFTGVNGEFELKGKGWYVPAVGKTITVTATYDIEGAVQKSEVLTIDVQSAPVFTMETSGTDNAFKVTVSKASDTKGALNTSETTFYGTDKIGTHHLYWEEAITSSTDGNYKYTTKYYLSSTYTDIVIKQGELKFTSATTWTNTSGYITYYYLTPSDITFEVAKTTGTNGKPAFEDKTSWTNSLHHNGDTCNCISFSIAPVFSDIWIKFNPTVSKNIGYLGKVESLQTLIGVPI